MILSTQIGIWGCYLSPTSIHKHILNIRINSGEDMRLCEMREKEVINLCDCKRLGCVVDLVFDECDGCIQALVVPAVGKFCGLFGSESEYIIPFECVKKIGPDIIMVEICEEKFLKSCKD